MGKEICFEIIEHIGTIKRNPTGWNKELNLVSWNANPPKYDIREWDSEHEYMRRGITLYPEEMQSLLNVMQGRSV